MPFLRLDPFDFLFQKNTSNFYENTREVLDGCQKESILLEEEVIVRRSARVAEGGRLEIG